MELGFGRNDLFEYIENETPLEEVLIAGRFLESELHDNEGCVGDHMHWYKKVLETYNPEADSVLLSEKGSRRLQENLEKPGKRYSKLELYEESNRVGWKVRETDFSLY